jgi:FkbM family methyltransferase
MSRFSNLKKHLSFRETISIYLKIKKGNYDNFRLKKLQHPFSIRKNPYDYATFEEVLLREDYNIDFGFEPRTIIDGGANIGLTSIYFASKYPQTKIVAVEPDKENFLMLEKNTKQYQGISVLNAGIWNRKANLEIVNAGLGNNAFTVKEVKDDSKNSINALAISDIIDLQRWKNADVVKLDIEGSEKKVFESGYELWLPNVKVLIVELHDRMTSGCSEAVFAAVSKHNFSGGTKGDNHIFYNKDLI